MSFHTTDGLKSDPAHLALRCASQDEHFAAEALLAFSRFFLSYTLALTGAAFAAPATFGIVLARNGADVRPLSLLLRIGFKKSAPDDLQLILLPTLIIMLMVSVTLVLLLNFASAYHVARSTPLRVCTQSYRRAAQWCVWFVFFKVPRR